MNKLITRSEIESIMLKKNSANRSPGLNGFNKELHPTDKEELILILLKLFQKTGEAGTLPKSFYEATITHLIPKPDKDTTKDID